MYVGIYGEVSVITHHLFVKVSDFIVARVQPYI